MSADFKGLAAELLQSSERHVSSWLSAGKRQGKEWVVGSLSNEPGTSLSINLNNGRWADFASGETGGDLIDLYAAIHGISMIDAYKELGGEVNPRAPRPMKPRTPAPAPEPTRRVVSPVPESVALHDCAHPKFGRPVRVWQYMNEHGELLGYVARYEPAGERKQIVPWTYDGERWGMGQWPEPRPMYGLQRLAEKPDAPVLLVAGEKAADAAHALAGKVYVAMTWPGGEMAWQKTDFSPIYGRKVLIWPDADATGAKCSAALGAHLLEHCPEVKILDVADQADGWDAADCTMTWPEFRAWAKPRAAVLAPIPAAARQKSPTLQSHVNAGSDVAPQSATASPNNSASAGPVHSFPREAGADQTPGPGASGGEVIALPAKRRRPAPADDVFIFSSTPLETAALFQANLPDDGKVLFWRGEFYTWNGHRYVVRDQVYLHQQLYSFMSSCLTHKTDPKTGDKEVVAFSPNKAHIENVMHALRAVCFIDLPEPPSWITAEPGDVPAGEIIAFRNGFLHAPTRRMMPSDPRLFVISALDFDYDATAPAPTEWLRFLSGLWPADPESIETLGSVFGYMLTDDTSQQKAFMMIGPPRCGKGTILRVLENMVGQHNRVSPSLASLGTQFGLQPLVGKRVAMISDARLSGKTDQQPIVENILRITGEDSLTVDRKFLGSWSGKLSTRFIMASNETPAFSDASGALANRFVMFKFSHSFLGHEDHGLTVRLLKELPGIVLWALDGLQRLQARGYLATPESGRELADEMREQASPIAAFVAEKCVVHPDAAVDRNDLFAVWKTWCQAQGMEHPGTMITFGRRLSAAFPGIGRSQPRDGGTRLNLYSGVRLQRVTEQFD
ncbi:MAG: Phage/plasmid primase P4-like protein [Steroidobacteraceae bacterium]|jgi:putative DNA primase/helicase|nr:Phage/plasmid primase P4-like protein [Steroidobacteraceae bacterium]